jgi:spore coat protein H
VAALRASVGVFFEPMRYVEFGAPCPARGAWHVVARSAVLLGCSLSWFGCGETDASITGAPAGMSQQGAPCQPRGSGGPFWFTEQDSIEIVLECGTGLELPGGDYQLLNPPSNAVYDAASRSIRFTPALDQAGVYELDIAVGGSGEVGRVQVQVADRFDAPDNVPVDPATYGMEFGLPVLHLGIDPNVNRDAYTPAAITYRGKTYANAEAKYRRQASSNYPKRSFTLKFARDDQFEDPLSVAGYTRKRRVTLTTTFNDNSYLRPRLAFELWNRLGADHVQVEAFNVVVYLSGTFWGLYSLIDHVDADLMEDNGLYEDGNLYKARNHDANFRLTRQIDPNVEKGTLSEGYTKEEGLPAAGEPGANDDLEALVRWVATSSREDFLAELDTADTAGKNSYHYRDPRPGADGRFHVVPWDFNDAFGQDGITERQLATRDLEELAVFNLLFERMLTEPETRGPLVARYRQLLDNEWQLDSVLESVDAWAREIMPVADRDWSRWGAAYAAWYVSRQDVTTPEQEIEFVRQWVMERWAYVRDYY